MSINMNIHNNTDFVKNMVGITKLNEFLDLDARYVKPGIPYHIHYTKAKEEFYMTGALHSRQSKFIIKLIPTTNFAKYKQSKNGKLVRETYISPYVLKITKEDHKKGSIIRYFARQANDENGEIFEISSNDFNLSTPFYKKVSLDWKFVGLFKEVKKHNEKQINMAKKVLPRIGNILSPRQFFKPAKKSKEYIFSQLHKEYSVATDTTETTTTSTSGGSGGY